MPDAALRFILRHFGVRQVRLIPQNSRALPAAFLRDHRQITFCSTFCNPSSNYFFQELRTLSIDLTAFNCLMATSI